MNEKQPERKRSAAVLAILTTCSLFAGCGDNVTLDARAAEPIKEVHQPGAVDPALDRLDAVTHHG